MTTMGPIAEPAPNSTPAPPPALTADQQTKYDTFLTDVWKKMQERFYPQSVALEMPPGYEENMRKVDRCQARTYFF